MNNKRLFIGKQFYTPQNQRSPDDPLLSEKSLPSCWGCNFNVKFWMVFWPRCTSTFTVSEGKYLKKSLCFNQPLLQQNNFTYPNADANISYFPGSNSLQYSPRLEVVMLWLIPLTTMSASKTGSPRSLLTNPKTTKNIRL